jgi:succinate dehydrogenase/fumarate reductase flavoprotein subunit
MPDFSLRTGPDLVTDVLVIGGGPAATWAAVSAREAGAEVVLVDKGYCGASGVAAAAGIGHWHVPPVPEMRRAAIRHRAELGFHLTDRLWQERVLDETWRRLPLLATWRYPFPVGEDGQPVLLTGSGPEYLRTMRRQVKRSGARILDHHPALELLTRDGAVVGAAGIERVSGQRWSIRARAVVLATGGCTWKSYSLGSNVDTGDGQLMAAEVGAWLSSMEFSNYWGMVPKGTSMDKNGFYGFATFTREDGTELPGDLMVDRGRLARYLLEGPVYAQLDRVPDNLVPGVRGRMINWRQTFDKLGIDPITQRYEIGMVNEGTVRGTGGLYIHDPDCSVGVPGLYAAGDVAARDRIVGATTGAGAPNAAWALSSGTWAGRAAARWARSTGTHYHSAGPVQPAGQAGLRPVGRPGPAEDWRHVVTAVQDQMLPLAKNAVRTEAILLDALRVLDDAWTTARQSLRATGTGVLRAREAAAMTAMGRWAYRSALARTESRGMHYRADHAGLDEGQRHRLLSGGLDEIWVEIDPAPLDSSASDSDDSLLESAS